MNLIKHLQKYVMNWLKGSNILIFFPYTTKDAKIKIADLIIKLDGIWQEIMKNLKNSRQQTLKILLLIKRVSIIVKLYLNQDEGKD